MATAKVTVNGTTIVDMTDATATADKILAPYTAYGADGSKLTGTASGGSSYADDVFAFQAKVTFNIVGTSGHSSEFAYVEDYVVTYAYDAGDDFYYRLTNAYLTFTDGQNQERYIFSPDSELYMEYDSSAWVVSVEGDAVVNTGDGIITVTGDCIINALLT